MHVSGDFRPGSEFRFEKPPGNLAQAPFVAVTSYGVMVARRVTDLFGLPDETVVIASWHGERRTDAFSMTVGDLKKLADACGA